MDLNERTKTIKFIEKNWTNFPDPGFGNDLLGMTPKAQATKAKTGKLDIIKIKNFCASKDPINRVTWKGDRGMGECLHTIYLTGAPAAADSAPTEPRAGGRLGLHQEVLLAPRHFCGRDLLEDAILAFKSSHATNPPFTTLPQHRRRQFLRTQALSPLCLKSIWK